MGGGGGLEEYVVAKSALGEGGVFYGERRIKLNADYKIGNVSIIITLSRGGWMVGGGGGHGK